MRRCGGAGGGAVKLADRLIARVTRRAPDFVIGGAERPYLRRWWVLPRNRFFSVYLHEFRRSDDDRALHDHPWLANASFLLRGRYLEHTTKHGLPWVDELHAGEWKFRWGAAPHRIELLRVPADAAALLPVWTLFLTGPKVREWGFFCGRGFVHWRDFTAPADKGSVGRGCE